MLWNVGFPPVYVCIRAKSFVLFQLKRVIYQRLNKAYAPWTQMYPEKLIIVNTKKTCYVTNNPTLILNPYI